VKREQRSVSGKLSRFTSKIVLLAHTADKGYNWSEFRHYLREAGVRPVIKHREFSSLDAAHNARIDDDTYHHRSVVESVDEKPTERLLAAIAYKNGVT